MRNAMVSGRDTDVRISGREDCSGTLQLQQVGLQGRGAGSSRLRGCSAAARRRTSDDVLEFEDSSRKRQSLVRPSDRKNRGSASSSSTTGRDEQVRSYSTACAVSPRKAAISACVQTGAEGGAVQERCPYD